ncbi:DMT family transporter [Coriobacteriia bacterium Es71-Z0120]|uniref:DMT family transporter n=1 Tax=Parvivirga hydrogeniphila TaxID=2939460 RepID=UPI002260D6F5|nr:DMT family transporter [Parvivirga hydrogeniphila]MCL4078486.1 DMT family transporter [Parvivirga hydrogeniphila]
MSRRLALVAVIVSAACFGTLGVLASLAYRQGMQPLPLLAWRFALVSVLMGAYQALKDPAALIAGAKDWWRYAALSITGYGAASVCYFFALKHASASIVAVLLYTYPAIVAALSAAFLHERLTGARVGAIALTVAGCAFVVQAFSPGARAEVAGIVLGLGAGLGYAVFNVLSYRWLPGRSRLVLMTYTFAVSAVAIGALCVLTGTDLSPAGWSPAAWGLLAAIVAVPTVAAVLLYLGGIRRLGASQAAIVSTTEPLFTIAFAAAVLGERLTASQAIGAALVLAGVALAEMRGSGAPPDELASV